MSGTIPQESSQGEREHEQSHQAIPVTWTGSRRRFLGGAALALLAPALARAKTTARPARVTLFFFGEGDEDEDARIYRALLAKEGFVEPRNLSLEVVLVRHETGVEAAVREVVARRPDLVILGWRGGRSALAFRAATQEIPIVFTGAGDPVRSGLVESLRRPGRNLTGSSARYHDLLLKRLELFKELRPDKPRLAVLVGETPRSDPSWEEFMASARKLGVSVIAVEKANGRKLDDLALALRQSKAGGFLSISVATSPGFWAELQKRSGVPGLFAASAVVKEGGLISLAASDEEMARMAVAIAARILRGESPASVPVDQAIAFDLAVNLGTARAMGIAVPHSILVRATKVYETAEGPEPR